LLGRIGCGIICARRIQLRECGDRAIAVGWKASH
jgi:hypothetical protein